jgi:hypothetical protein
MSILMLAVKTYMNGGKPHKVVKYHFKIARFAYIRLKS